VVDGPSTTFRWSLGVGAPQASGTPGPRGKRGAGGVTPRRSVPPEGTDCDAVNTTKPRAPPEGATESPAPAYQPRAA
jgi:hypothetical protein